MVDTSNAVAPTVVTDLLHPLAGRTALVTGGSRGIGLGIATLLGQRGARVVLASRREAGLISAVQEIQAAGVPGDRVSYQVAKADSDSDAEASVAHALDRYGSLDILVNNAATNPYYGPLVGITRGQADKTTAVNQWGPLSWIQAAWRHYMAEHGGAVLNIASTSGIAVDKGLGWYGVTKAALIHLTELLAMELAPTIRVNAIAPGLIKTDLSRALWENGGETAAAANLPLRRLGTPGDIAEAAAFLCSDAASWITGQTLVVDGGLMIRPTP
jgi:NAD(P)-dependent dehydrogenase (short-subunit alcohol dehydrogenase family)